MKRHIFAVVSMAITLAATAGAQTPTQTQAPAPTPTQAPAQSRAPNKVGVIQIQSAIVATKDGQKAVAELETKLAPRKKDLDRKAAEIRDLQDKLQKSGDKMAATAKDELVRNIDQKTKSYNRDMEDAQAEADQEQRKLIDELGQKMMQVIDKYAQVNAYSVILDVSNPNTPVLYASNTVDITKDIIELYDKSMQSPATPKPTGGAATPPAKTAPTPVPPVVKKQSQ